MDRSSILRTSTCAHVPGSEWAPAFLLSSLLSREAPLLEMPVFAPLEEGEAFSRFEIVHGVVCWAGGEIDLAPEKMRELSCAYERIA